MRLKQKEAGGDRKSEDFQKSVTQKIEQSPVSQKIDERAETPAPEIKPEIKPEPTKPTERRTDTKLANAFGTNRSYVAAAQKGSCESHSSIADCATNPFY